MIGGRGGKTVSLNCEQCKQDYTIRASLYEAQVRQSGGRKYCSRACYAVAKKIKMTPEVAPTFSCAHCGTLRPYPARKDGRGFVYKQRYCDRECASLASKHNAGLPLRRRERHGYIEVFSGGRGGKYEKEHRLKMETRLGRKLLPDETVHHINGQRDDNSDENLELWSCRHGKGQRVTDKLEYAASLFEQYPELAAEMGYRLIKAEKINLSTFKDMMEAYGDRMSKALDFCEVSQ